MRKILIVSAVALAFVGLSTPAHAVTAGTISVPSDFVGALSDTRTTGSYEVVGTGLHIATTGSTSTDKVAEYVATDTTLATVGEPSLEYTNTTAAGIPGFQLVVDFDGNGSLDGILIGEPGAYGNDWWLNNAAKPFVKLGAPLHGGGYGSDNHGTLAQWRAAFPTATVKAFGFSLGSGVKGDGVLDAISFAGVRYTFVATVTLTSKAACKVGGWMTSNNPTFSNQGDCVSYFATK